MAVCSWATSRLDANNLDDYTRQLQSWSGALSDDGDILLYGCNVADGDWGIDFVQDLASLSGADVAASNDLTGSTARGGDWNLEFATGVIDAQLSMIEEAGLGYQGVLAAPIFTNNANVRPIGDTDN